MKGRGQRSFATLPTLAAKLYDRLTDTRAIALQTQEIAHDLVGCCDHGRFLDIGSGPGKLLLEVHRLNPAVELYGLDISSAMVQLAGEYLKGVKADMRCGDVQHSPYADDFFDCISCTGSFYLWDSPVQCVDEIFRILKPRHAACLYETHRDYDAQQLQQALHENLQTENLLRRLISPIFLKHQLHLTYHQTEVEEIIQQTRFSKSYKIERITLAGLPVWLRIELARY